VADNHKSAYAVLGLHKGASLDDIKKAYVQLVKKYDPERHTDRFMIVQNAFDRLKTPASRAREDVRAFNYIRGEFFFSAEEKTQLADAQIDQGLRQLEEKINSGQVDRAAATPKLIQGLMMRSYKRVQKKLWAEAIEDWQRVLELDPAHRRAKNNLLYSYITLGYSYASHGLYDEAVDVLKRAATMNPDGTEIIHNLALACEHAGRVEEARRYWQEVIKRWRAQLNQDPDNEYLKACLVEALKEKGQSGEAPAEEKAEGGAPAQARGTQEPSAPRAAHSVEDLREILRLNPNDFESHFRLASLLYNEQKWEEATKELEEMQRRFPRNIEVLNLLGWAMLNSGRIKEAFMVWRRARTMDPKNPQITESLIKANMSIGRTLRDKGLYTQCLVHFKELTRYLPENDEVHYEIGLTYQLKGDERSAFQEYQKVLKINPRHRGARHGLSSLKLRR